MSDIEELEKPEVTLRDDLRSSIADLLEKPEEQGNEDLTKIGESEVKRMRDEQGRFAPQKETPQDPKAQSRETIHMPDKQPAQQVQTNGAKVPESLPAELKAEFAQIPLHWQQYLTRREEDVHKALTRQDNERLFGKRVLEATMPYMDIIQREGGDPLAAYNLYLTTARTLRMGTPQQKVEALISVARQFNVPLDQPVQQGQFYQDPRLDNTEQRLGQVVNYLQQLEQNRQAQEQSQLHGEINSFASEPGHEYFSHVRNAMGILLESGQAQNLQDAYDRAVWSDPQIRSTLMAKGPSGQKQIPQAAQRARQAAVSVTGGPGGSMPNSTNDPNRSLRDEIRANLRASEGRG